ncbi:amidohydrolase family protein [Hymenobacter edaphi]|uniref:Amidohydrolase n=1 Tax=Hymenobacter edaphi TaxID=2211146 RepID=A0A328BVV4_9BACT|nr:amidohydrolase family protein [Hymenobacter edaphi]RAK70641.1 amidohydrolase [Hymenobacter edaphi]
MARIDAHQHFWLYQPERDAWITDDMAVIRRDFGPADLEPLLEQHGFDGCVVVQSDQTEAENDFQLANAAANDFIRGVVGWVDLRAADVAERLAYYSQFAKLKGFRHVLQGEADRALMLTPAFQRGIRALAAHGFTYDVLIFPDQLRHAAALAAAHPNQPFVLDHIAKPYIRHGDIDGWKQDLQQLAAHENVWCKASGLITEADWHRWQPADFRPYLDVVFEAFGPGRVMFGSDWPVCLVAGRYGQVVDVVQQYLQSFSADEQRRFWGDNARQFYGL